MSPWVILAAAAFTGLTSLSLGLLLLRALRIRLHRDEAWPLAYVLGSAGLSLIVFAMLTLWVARTQWFVAVGVLIVAGAVWKRAWRIEPGPELAPLPRWWRWIFAGGLAYWGVYTFIHALAPEVSPDGSAYHLGLVNRWFHSGGFDWYTTNMYANMPMGVEMLFLFAYSLGRHSAAALVHWQFYFVLPLLLLNVGRRFGHPVAGAVAGLLVFLSPVAAVDGASAYVDMAVAAVLTALFALLTLAETQRSRGLLLAIGALAGFAYSCKMTAFPALPLALAWVAWILWRSRELTWRPLALVALAGALFIAPWLAKSAMMVGNPFSPFLNRWFPNPYIRVVFEEEYRASLRDYYGQIKSPAQIPLEVTTKGAILQGLLGPVFLLAPLALVALRWPLGRRALLAALIFGAAYPSNIGTRFLLLPLPFLSLAMGLALSHWRGTASAVALFHAWMSLPWVVKEYSEPYAWRLDTFRWKQALRIESEDSFFGRISPNIMMARYIERNTPPHARIMTYANVSEAHTSRDVIVVYQGALNMLLGEILAGGMSEDLQAGTRWMFQFPKPVQTRRIRVVQTEPTAEQWSVSELRVYNESLAEHDRPAYWRIKAQPNHWDVGLAFDNCRITRWRTWQSSRAGDYIELDFGLVLQVGGVRVEGAFDNPKSVMRVQYEVQPGVWETIQRDAEVLAAEPLQNPRLAAIDDLKRYGITHLAISNTDFIAADLSANKADWGIELMAEIAGTKLYRLK